MTEVGNIFFDAELDDSGLIAATERAAKRASQEAEVTFTADADFRDLGAKAALAARRAKARVPFEVDTRSVRSEVGALGTIVEGALGGIGSLAGRFSLLAGAAAAAAPLIAALAAAVAALVGQLAAAAVGGGIGLAGVLGSIGLAAASVKVGLVGLDDAFSAVAKAQQEQAASGKVSAETMKAQQQALAGLAPSARSFVRAVTDVADEWTKMARAVQQPLFQGLGAAIRQVTATLLPVLQTALVEVAQIVNGVAREFVRWATSAAGVKIIQTILSGLAGVLRTLASALGPIAAGLTTLFVASLPFIQDFATAIANIGKSFGTWAQGVVQSGQLQRFLLLAFAAGQQLFAIVRNVGSILGSVFGAGAALGQGFLQVLVQASSALAAFFKSAEGQQALSTFFQVAQQRIADLFSILRSLLPVITPIVAAMGQVGSAIAQAFSKIDFGALATNLQPILNALVAGIQAILPAVVPIINAVIAVVGQLGPVFSTVVGIIVSAVQSLAPVVTQVVGVIGSLVSALAPVFAGLAPVIQQVVSIIAQAVGTVVQGISANLPALQQAFTAVGAALTTVGTLITQVWSAIGPVVLPLLSTLATLLSGVLAGALTTFAGLLQTVAALLTGDWAGAMQGAQTALQGMTGFVQTWIDALGNLAGVIGSVVGTILANFSGLAGRVISAAGNLSAAFAAWVANLGSQAVSTAANIVRAFVGMANKIISAAGSILAAFGAWVAGLRGAAARTAANIVSAFAGLAGRIIRGAGNLLSAFGGWVSGVVGAAERAASGIVSAFFGLGGRIIDAIGTIIPRISLPDIPGIGAPFAEGGIVTKPTLALIGEAGPEAVIPLRRSQRIDPDITDLLRSVADARVLTSNRPGWVGRNGTIIVEEGASLITVVLPTGDPMAAAKAVNDRLALVQTV